MYLPISFIFKLIQKARQRPTLTKGNPSLPSALRSLTSVFGMVTGVSFLPSSPHLYAFYWVMIHSKLDVKLVSI